MSNLSVTSAPSAAASRWLGIACGIVAALIWGVQAVVSRQSVGDGLSAGDVTILRFGTAALLLLPYALTRMRPFPVGRLGWRRALALTALVGPGYSMLLIGGAHFAPALHSSLITPSLVPVYTAAMCFLAFGERTSWLRLGGLALIIGGIALFSLEAMANTPARDGAWIGDAIFVLVALLWSSFGLLARRWDADPIEVTVATCLLSVPFLPLIWLVVPGTLFQADPGAVALQAVYQGLVVCVLALFLYVRTVALLGAAVAALFMPLVPVFTAIAGAILIGEIPTPTEVAGLGVALAGMTVALRAQPAPPR